MKRLAEPLAGLTGREAAFPNASPEAGSGEFKTESGDRSGFPVGPLPRNSERVLCAFARSGFPVRVRYCFLPSVAPIRNNRRNASDLAYGPRSRSGGSASFAFGSPWWASSGRPPRFRLPRGSPQAIRFLAGFSSAFNHPSLGRSAGWLKALPLVGINVSRLHGFGVLVFFTLYRHHRRIDKGLLILLQRVFSASMGGWDSIDSP